MSCSNDIVIEDQNIRFYFEYLEWDSEFFSKKSYSLNIYKSTLGTSVLIKEEIIDKFKNCFITIKLSTSLDVSILFFLQKCGFYYVDTEIVLEYVLNNNSQKKDDNIKIIKKKVNSDLPYNEFGNAFSLTRFHTDINIPNLKANELWINYLKNYKLSAKKHMFTAEDKGKVVGVILVNIEKDIAILFYVSVLKEYEGLGIGTQLMNEVLKYFKNYRIVTETQIKNINAMNYYIRNGLNKINNTLTVLHRW